MDDFAFHRPQLHYIYGSSGQYVNDEQAVPVPGSGITRNVELVSDADPASIEFFNQTRLVSNNDDVPAQTVPNETSANESKITLNKEVIEENKPFRRFTIGMPVKPNDLIASSDPSMNEPMINLWRRNFQDAGQVTKGFMDGSSWEQRLSNDTTRPFTSSGCLGTLQDETKFRNEDLSSASMKSFDDNERIRSMSELTHTYDLAFFEHLTSTNITKDLHERCANLPSDLSHIQKNGLKRSFGHDILLLEESNEAIQKESSTSANPIKKAKKEKDPKKLADRRNKRRESHNAVERRRRGLINDRIAELAMLLPRNDLMDAIAQSANGGTLPHINLKPFLSQRPDLLHETFLFDGLPLDAIAQSRPNKGIILTKAVEYIRYLQDLCTILRQVNERLQSENKSETQNL